MKPISPIGLGLMFLARFASNRFGFDKFCLNLQPKFAPLKPKILATSLGGRRG